ncbi:MAG: terminase gpA endonuclease subunit [Chthoniobacteraceae bacterium]
MFSSNWFPDLVVKAFAKIPDIPIWEWASKTVYIEKTSEPGFYRPSRTPWTKRLQDLLRRPWHNGHRIRRYGARKSSQGGFTEALLNAIRWAMKHKPREVMFSIDSQKEVDNIRDRLLSTMERLGEEIFTGDRDDLAKYKLVLRRMTIYLTGSFTGGAFSNKYVQWVFNDEVDLYNGVPGEGDTITNYWSRIKTDDDGFQAVLSKPAYKGGPIDQFYEMGNQEHYMVRCPHTGCRKPQSLEFDRLEFNHCKDLTGTWDMEKLLTETFYRCKHCGEPIYEHHKKTMLEEAYWQETAKGDPEIITQWFSDLYVLYKGSTWGHLAKECVQAATSGRRDKQQSFRAQRLGLGWEERVQKVEHADLFKLRRPYKRGTIPEAHCALILGMDIGLYVNTKWVIYAFNKSGAMWLIDWGTADGPSAAITILREKRYRCLATDAVQSVRFGFIDARYRTDEVYETCLCMPRVLYPVWGSKTDISSRSIRYVQIPGKPEGFGVLQFSDRDAKFDLYIDTIKYQGTDKSPIGQPPLYWPEDLDDVLVREHAAEQLIRDKRTGRVIWEEDHKRPNHFGDGTKIARTGVDWMIGGKRSRIIAGLDHIPNTNSEPEPGAVESGGIEE